MRAYVNWKIGNVVVVVDVVVCACQPPLATKPTRRSRRSSAAVVTLTHTHAHTSRRRRSVCCLRARRQRRACRSHRGHALHTQSPRRASTSPPPQTPPPAPRAISGAYTNARARKHRATAKHTTLLALALWCWCCWRRLTPLARSNCAKAYAYVLFARVCASPRSCVNARARACASNADATKRELARQHRDTQTQTAAHYGFALRRVDIAASLTHCLTLSLSRSLCSA